jgi:hypothetical protein
MSKWKREEAKLIFRIFLVEAEISAPIYRD